MLRNPKILLPAALLGALPFAASAEIMDRSELDMFRNAQVTMQQAGETAVQAHPGDLAAIVFGDEDGRAAYRAMVVGKDGESWTMLIDAQSGEIFASGKSSAMQDHEDHAKGQDNDYDGDHDGETDDD